MKKEKKSLGSLLADIRWAKASPEEKSAVGRALTDARLAKNAGKRKKKANKRKPK